MKVPTSTRNPAAFRGQASSEEFNAMNDALLKDVLKLFDTANELEVRLDEANNHLKTNAMFQQLYARKLEQRIQSLEGRLQSRVQGKEGEVHQIYTEDFIHDPNTPERERLQVDPAFGVAHLPYSDRPVSKVYLYDAMNDYITLPDALKVKVYPETLKGASIKDTDPYRALNGDNHEFWQRKVYVPMEDTPKGGVQSEMVITLPDTIISSRDVNMITLKGYPVHSMQIDKVEYRQDGDWQLVPGWKTDPHSGAPLPVEYLGNLKLCFPNTDMAEIRISMTQFNWYEENMKKVYHFGLQEVGVFQAGFTNGVGRIDVPVSLRKETDSVYLTGLNPIFENEEAFSGRELSSLFNYSIYTIDEFERLHYTKDAFPVITDMDRVLIRVVIHPDPNNGVTPVLKGLELTYEPVD